MAVCAIADEGVDQIVAFEGLWSSRRMNIFAMYKRLATLFWFSEKVGGLLTKASWTAPQKQLAVVDMVASSFLFYLSKGLWKLRGVESGVSLSYVSPYVEDRSRN